jgi:hypothetical protein
VRDFVNIFIEKEQPFLMSFINKNMFLADMQAKPDCSTPTGPANRSVSHGMAISIVRSNYSDDEILQSVVGNQLVHPISRRSLR